jgi:hypothetical protein
MKKATAKVTENRDAVTVEEHVNFAVDASHEAYDAVEGSGPAKQTAAAEAFRRCMPLLESRSSVKGFIACVAQGVHLGFITTEEARVLMYGAQLWLQIEAGKVAA